MPSAQRFRKEDCVGRGRNSTLHAAPLSVGVWGLRSAFHEARGVPAFFSVTAVLSWTTDKD